MIESMTGAELQTMREACNLSREGLASLAGVQARTIKHWESGRAGVPADVAALIERLDDLIDTQASQAIQTLTTTQTPPMLIRYASDDDMRHYLPALRAMPASLQGAILGRASRQLCETFGMQSRIVWMRPEVYEAWRAAHQLPDTEASRQQWGADQLSAQTRPHRADQPPV